MIMIIIINKKMHHPDLNDIEKSHDVDRSSRGTSGMHSTLSQAWPVCISMSMFVHSSFVRSFVCSNVRMIYISHPHPYIASPPVASLTARSSSHKRKEYKKEKSRNVCASNSSKDESCTRLRISVLRRLWSNNPRRAEGRD